MEISSASSEFNDLHWQTEERLLQETPHREADIYKTKRECLGIKNAKIFQFGLDFPLATDEGRVGSWAIHIVWRRGGKVSHPIALKL